MITMILHQRAFSFLSTCVSNIDTKTFIIQEFWLAKTILTLHKQAKFYVYDLESKKPHRSFFFVWFYIYTYMWSVYIFYIHLHLDNNYINWTIYTLNIGPK